MAKKVLLADDTESVRMVVREALHNAQLDSTGDPREAVSMAQEGNYDVILVDLTWKLPGLSMSEGMEVGYMLLENVIGLAPEVYLYTNQTFRRYIERAVKMGATGVVEKSDMGRLRKLVYG